MDGLQYASVKVPTVKGMVSVEWRQTSDSKDYTLMAAIPVNSVATVYLPKQGRSGITIREGDTVIWQAGKSSAQCRCIDKIVDAGLWINVSAGSEPTGLPCRSETSADIPKNLVTPKQRMLNCIEQRTM